MSAQLNGIDRATPATAKLRGEISPKRQPQWLSDLVADVVHADRSNAKVIADALGVKLRAVYAAADRHDASALPAGWIPTVCLELKSFAILDALEAQVGRVAFSLPQVKPTVDEMHLELARTVTGFGTFLQANGLALADRRIEPSEAKPLLSSIDAMLAGVAEYRAMVVTKLEQDAAA